LRILIRSILGTDPMPPSRIAVDIKFDNKPHVVGIGASAGRLEALSQFVAGLLPDLGCIYVVTQHMSPTHRSLMAEILARETRLPVQELTDGELPRLGSSFFCVHPLRLSDLG
jgi:chemotaxis response regulator CheB